MIRSSFFKCAQCGQSDAKRCAACQSVYYCNKVCQTAHWPQHKKECKRLKEEREAEESKGAGGGAFASQMKANMRKQCCPLVQECSQQYTDEEPEEQVPALRGRAPWGKLPDALLLRVLRRLRRPMDVVSAGQVCRQWRRVSREQVLWEKVRLDDYSHRPGTILRVLKAAPSINSLSLFDHCNTKPNSRLGFKHEMLRTSCKVRSLFVRSNGDNCCDAEGSDPQFCIRVMKTFAPNLEYLQIQESTYDSLKALEDLLRSGSLPKLKELYLYRCVTSLVSSPYVFNHQMPQGSCLMKMTVHLPTKTVISLVSIYKDIVTDIRLRGEIPTDTKADPIWKMIKAGGFQQLKSLQVDRDCYDAERCKMHLHSLKSLLNRDGAVDVSCLSCIIKKSTDQSFTRRNPVEGSRSNNLGGPFGGNVSFSFGGNMGASFGGKTTGRKKGKGSRKSGKAGPTLNGKSMEEVQADFAAYAASHGFNAHVERFRPEHLAYFM